MYAQYFGLKKEPFSIAPDPRYLYMSERHRDALAHLLYGVGGGGGFVLLTGEIGAGKTTVCRAFLEQVPSQCHVAYIFNPKLTVGELLSTVCEEFQIALPTTDGRLTLKNHIDAINTYLLQTHAQGHSSVLIIDEAQNLSPQVLEQLRLLTNLETSERKLLQIILIGQPELRDMLMQPGLEQLAQRVIARYHLQALSATETTQYVAHRLAVAGLGSGTLFEPKALRRIYQLSGGVPRRINLLCDRALLGAYAKGRSSVDVGIVKRAAQEVFEQLKPSKPVFVRQPHLWRRVPVLFWGVLGGISISCFVAAAALMVTRPKQPERAERLAQGAAANASTPAPTPAKSASATSVVSPQAPKLATTAELDVWLNTAIQQEYQAWVVLAPLWRLELNPVAPCGDAPKRGVQCFKSTGGLALIAQLDRPSIITLYNSQGKPAYALLTGLNKNNALLQSGTSKLRVSMAALAGAWRGEFGTLWRPPEGYKKRIETGQSGPAVDWLAATMARMHGETPPQGAQTYTPALQAKVYAFQVTQGIKPDGMAGAKTLMQLNRAVGVDEPRLNTER